MTGKNLELATSLDEVAGDCFYRIWCAAHQLDLVVQKITNTILDEDFVPVLQRMTEHLGRQKTLISSMGYQFLKFVNTRWLSMGRLLSWFVSKRGELPEHFNIVQPSCMSSKSWRIIMHVFNVASQLCNFATTRLQGNQHILEQQLQI